MVADLFESLLKEIGEALQIPDLHPDTTNSCLVGFPNDVKVQLEIDKRGEFLIMGSELGMIPPGRYRENIFRAALKANGQPWPRIGIFAFSRKADQLILFEKLPLNEINATKVLDVLTPFVEKAFTWKEAIFKGETPMTTATSSGRMFGLT